MRIAYAVHGRGRGHASRARSLLPALAAKGHELCVMAGGDAQDLLAQTPFAVHAVPSVPRGLAGARVWRIRIAQDRRLLLRVGAQLLISDGDGPSLMAARRLGVPSIAVGHGLVFGRTLVRGGGRRQRWAEAINALSSSYGAQTKIAVHFLPVIPRFADTQVARPDLSELLALMGGERAGAGERTGAGGPARTGGDAGAGERTVSYFRDRNGAAVLRECLQQGLDLCHFGHLDSAPDGLVRAPLERQAFLRALVGAETVVASAGSNLIAEAICLKIPMLACYRAGDREQAMNAQLLEAANLGQAFCLDEDPKPAVASFVARVRARDFDRSFEILDMAPVSRVLLGAVERYGKA